jgi:flavin reductase (DIM6/NTAB) family NADH-FMN oxidoreductase RutF
MEIDFDALAVPDRYKLLVSTVVPRPIAWIVTQNEAGLVNAAPYSFFQAIGAAPPLLMVSIEGRTGGGLKDTAANIARSGQFVINLVSYAMTEAMVVTAIEFDPAISEVDEAKLATLPSTRIAPPRIADSPVAFECERYQTVELPHDRHLVLGRILTMHIAEDAMENLERNYVDTPKLDLVGRMNGPGMYARTRDVYEVPRIPLDTWKRAAE